MEHALLRSRGPGPIPRHPSADKVRVRVAFFRGTSLRPVPPASPRARTRELDIHEDDLDKAQLAAWAKQASQLPEWPRSADRHPRKPVRHRTDQRPNHWLLSPRSRPRRTPRKQPQQLGIRGIQMHSYHAFDAAKQEWGVGREEFLLSQQETAFLGQYGAYSQGVIYFIGFSIPLLTSTVYNKYRYIQ